MSKAISMKIRFTDEKLPLGSGRFLGNPDVWKGFSWPEYRDGEDWHLMDFICQLDCRELAPFDREGSFPKSGLLYFFYPLEEPPFALGEADPVCYYYNGEKSQLEEALVQFEDGGFFGSREQRVEFTSEEDPRLPCPHLLGEPLLPPFEEAAEGLEDKILLFELPSVTTDDRQIRFWDDGTLQFYADPEKLKRGEVAEVTARLITT